MRLIRKFFGPLSIEFSGFRPSFALTFHRDQEQGTLHLGLLLADLYISHERWAAKTWEDSEYGFAVYGGALVLHWGVDDGRHIRFLHLAGQWHHLGDRKREVERGTHPYIYRWKYRDVVQHTSAVVRERLDVRQYRIGRLRLPIYRRRRSIWCNFAEELGDQRDSWKGGVLGAGADIQRGETWADAYRRMQQERTFCRGK